MVNTRALMPRSVALISLYPICLGFSQMPYRQPPSNDGTDAQFVISTSSTERATRSRKARTALAGPLTAYWIPRMGIACTTKLVPYSVTVTSTVAFTLL